MKKLIIPAIMAMAILSSCGGNGQQKAADSNNAAQTENTAQSENKDKVSTSPDLDFFELQGPVQSVVGDGELSPKYEFSKDGKLVSKDGDTEIFTRQAASREATDDGDFYELPKFKRNAQGFIEEIDYYESTTTYFWKNNRVEKYEWVGEGCEGYVAFTYNDKGELTQMCEQTKDESEEDYSNSDDPHCTSFKVTKRDKYNNWVEREVMGEDPYTETRFIEYFE